MFSHLLAAIFLLPVKEADDFERVGPQGEEHRAAILGDFRMRSLRLVRGGEELEILDGALVRRRGDSERELVPVDGSDPGRILALAADPAGPTWVAAERGIYLADPESEVLDRVELGSGAPPGDPTGVWVDGQRRVWITTDRSFGVIDPAFFWGRSFGAEDGLPSGPYRMVYPPAARGEAPWLVTPEAVWRYRVDEGRAPEVVEVILDGLTLEAGDTVALEHGIAPALSARGSGRGGADLRWRLDGHQVWRPLGEPLPTEELRPGRRRLQLMAIDRDLRRSEPFEVFLEVAYPRAYAPAALGGAVAAGVVLLAIFFRCLARGRDRGRETCVRTLASTAIATGLVLQVIAACLPHARGWPFIGFTMYTRSYQSEELIHEGILTGIDRRGRPVYLNYHAVGFATDSRWNVLRALISGGDEAGEQFVADFNGRRDGDPLRGVQVRSRRVRLTPDGPVRVAPIVLSHYLRPDPDREGER